MAAGGTGPKVTSEKRDRKTKLVGHISRGEGEEDNKTVDSRRNRKKTTEKERKQAARERKQEKMRQIVSNSVGGEYQSDKRWVGWTKNEIELCLMTGGSKAKKPKLGSVQLRNK